MAKRGLGKGMDAFLDTSNVMAVESHESIREIRISDIEPNKNQPRKNFDKDALKALSDSIREHGVITPILVMKTGTGYEIIAGERRWRASRMAGLKTIPAVVRTYSEVEIKEVALIENIQREDLNPIEEAVAYQALIDEFGFTQEEISEKIGKSRSKVANSLRLLALEPEFQKFVISGEISEGHARCVLSLKGAVLREFLINRIIEDGLSVREAEKLAKDLSLEKRPKKEKKQPDSIAIEIERIRKNIEDRLGTKVSISHGKKKGKIEIEYYGNEDLDRLLELLNLLG